MAYNQKIIVEGNITTSSFVVSGDISFTGSGADVYRGRYIVVPKTIEQILETANKLMRENVRVKEIPYAETANQYGITVSIAS